MPFRGRLALVAAALMLCVPVLSSCGFNKATDRPYTQADGTNYREGSVWVLNAVIAAAQSGSGTLIASFSNQSDTSTRTVESVAGASGNTVTASDFDPITIPAMGFVNLADDSTKITLTGSFAAGDIIPLSVNLTDGSTITMSVPVVYACQGYADLDVSQTSAIATPAPGSDSTAAVPTDGGTKVAPTAVTPISPTDPSSTGSASETASATDGASASPSDTSEPSSSESPSAYTCGTSGGTGGRG